MISRIGQTLSAAWGSRKKWLIVFTLSIFFYLWLAYYTETYIVPGPFSFMINNFGGNLVAGILGGFQFLFLAFYLDAQTEEKIDRIKETVIKSEELISRREEILEQEQTIFHFEQFLKNENWHNVRFPDIKEDEDDLGLTYEIRPVRDPSTNEPVMLSKEMSSYYVIKMIGPPHAKFMSAKERLLYENSPIKENHFYFCQFINGSWSMGAMDPFEHRFYLSGKIGPVETAITANAYMESRLKHLEGKELVTEWLLNDYGREPNIGEGARHFQIHKEGQSIFLTIGDSLPKSIYYTTAEEVYDDSKAFLAIEDMRGFASGESLVNIKLSVEAKAKSAGVIIPKIPWYHARHGRI